MMRISSCLVWSKRMHMMLSMLLASNGLHWANQILTFTTIRREITKYGNYLHSTAKSLNCYTWKGADLVQNHWNVIWKSEQDLHLVFTRYQQSAVYEHHYFRKAILLLPQLLVTPLLQVFSDLHT
jgi:hypothetical protein